MQFKTNKVSSSSHRADYSLSIISQEDRDAPCHSVVGGEMRMLFEALLRVSILLPVLLILIFTVRLFIKADGCLNGKVPQQGLSVAVQIVK